MSDVGGPGPVPEAVQVPAVWVGLETLPIQLGSTFLVQMQAPNELVLTIGQTAPPVLVGTPEEQAAQARTLPFVQVKPLVRLSLTPHRARELIGILQQVLQGHDQAFGGGAR